MANLHFIYVFFGCTVWDIPHCVRGILPNQGSNPCPLPWELSLNHWTARQVPSVPLLKGHIDLCLDGGTVQRGHPCSSLGLSFHLGQRGRRSVSCQPHGLFLFVFFFNSLFLRIKWDNTHERKLEEA